LAALALGAVVMNQLPGIGARALLHPSRRHVTAMPPNGCRATTVAGAGVQLAGWRCDARGHRRASLVFLHGISDNRVSGVGVIERFTPGGFDVVMFDSRAHGESEGDACTYGYFEKQDLRHVVDSLSPGPVVLMGMSLGAAIALQEAAEDPRIAAVVGVETFSDLRTVATERAPFFFTAGVMTRAFSLAEQQARFSVDAVSPLLAAAHIHAPVLLIHGDADIETRPDHSRRVFAALRGPRRLILVPGAAHNGSLRAEVWPEVVRWLDSVIPAH
jgi:pimeloyl-ACP methyl ester carboxylesterase